MKKLLAMVLTGIGVLAAGAASLGCVFFLMDEPKMCKSIIDK